MPAIPRSAPCLAAALPLAALLALGGGLTLSAPLSAQSQSDGTANSGMGSDAVPAPLVPMAEVEQAWEREDFTFVRQALAQLAEQTGTPLAQYRYGRVLLEGRGGPRDLDGATLWLEKAVAQDHIQAATLLARVYLSAPEGARDGARAAALLTGSAARGDAEAQYYLALLVSAGDGVPKDEARAVSWLLAAAEQQHAEAQYALARAYARGAGTAEDPAKARRWLEEAAANNHRDAQFYLANAYDNGQGVPLNKTEALRWYLRAAEQGLPLAQRRLGTRYLRGEDVAADAETALHWLTAAAEAGDPGAMANLGWGYARGQVLPKDDALAAHWYDRAADTGLGRAQLALGLFYQTGRGVEVDLAKAVKLYRQAAEQDTPGASAQLASLAISGQLETLMAPHDMVPWVAAAARQQAEENADQEANEALSWLQSRAGEDIRPAQLALAQLYLEQGGDAATAAQLLDRAAQAGDATAQAALGQLYTTGTGVALDYVQAHKWLNIAAASGAAGAADTREVIAQLMTPEQIAEAQSAARSFFESPPPIPQTAPAESDQ